MTSIAPQPDRRIASVRPLVPAWRVDRAFDYFVPDKLAKGVAPGVLVRVPFGHRIVRGVVGEIRVRAEGTGDLEEIKSLVLEDPVCPPPLDELAAWVATRYVVPRARVLERFVPRRVRVQPAVLTPPPRCEARALLGYQGGEALAEALGSGSGSGSTWLLHALPNSDRPALIAELAGLACSGGRTGLIAVPEVRYGSRVIEGLESLWGQIGRADTAVGEPERARGWLGAAAGGVVAGGRSAVFVPAPNLGLVVIDEEHHPSYKEHRSPRYDARRVAVERTRLQKATCVLISGCPSVEAGAAATSGRFGWAAPPRAALRAARPIVEVVEPAEGRILHRTFHARIHEAVSDGRRVAVLSPRRGFARTMWCRQCRRSIRCPRCETGLFFDREQGGGGGEPVRRLGAGVPPTTPISPEPPRPPAAIGSAIAKTEGGGRGEPVRRLGAGVLPTKGRVRCGRCGFSAPAPSSCPYCGGAEFAYLGAGSERMAEQLAKAFPSAGVLRVDPDVLDGEPPEGSEARIYVTTWVGTKEIFRPDVSLVAVLDADVLIRSPDFRAAERAYQALAEMAEWAGPAHEGGRLLVGSREPGHHAIQAIARADYRFFLERELDLRSELGYPPFSELVKISISGEGAPNASADVAEVCREAGARVLGPVTSPAGGQRSARRSREGEELEILAKAVDANEVARALRGILASTSRARIRVDVDPR